MKENHCKSKKRPPEPATDLLFHEHVQQTQGNFITTLKSKDWFASSPSLMTLWRELPFPHDACIGSELQAATAGTMICTRKERDIKHPNE